MAPEIEHERVAGDGGVTLHVARAGPADGVPVVLLHGFPENWQSWRHQLPALGKAGFNALAPDLRGYNLSDRPRDRAAYHLRHLVADIAAIVRARPAQRAHIVGHDWGGVIAWTLTGMHPELVDRLAIINAPHMAIYLRKMWRPPQIFRSWYLLLFRVPGLAEWALSAGNFRALRDMFGRYPSRQAFPAEIVESFIQALSPPGALTAALEFYRANLASDGAALARSARIPVETLVIWGERDPALSTTLLDGLERVAPRVRVHRLPDVSHWVQNEVPELTNRLLTEFFSKP